MAVADGGTGASTACGARTNLGLGTIATQAASNVSITGGSITGITDLAVADGGTGASSAPAARTNLGATTVGSNFFTLTNPSAITFIRINADNTVSALSAADFRTAIGAGTGGGSVTCVNTSGSVNGLTLTGGPITTTGTVTLGGGVNVSTITTGTLPVARGGTGLCTVGSSGNVLTSNGTAWVSQAVAGGGANVQAFPAGGTYTKPPGTKFIMVELWGAGGGGGGGRPFICPQPCDNAKGGAGGGGGAYTYKMFNAPDVGATETVTIGAGGPGGGPNVSGTNGGTTNFGTLLFSYGGTGGAVGPQGRGGVTFSSPGAATMPGGPSTYINLNMFGGDVGQHGGFGGGPGGTGNAKPAPAPAQNVTGSISLFGGGGGGGGYASPATTNETGTGGAGRVFGAPPSILQTPLNTLAVPSEIPRIVGGGGNVAKDCTPTGTAAVAGNIWNGGGAGKLGPAPKSPVMKNGANGGLAGGGGGGSRASACINTAGSGGAGGNGYAIVWSWS